MPRQHLAKVVQRLAREGWLTTTRGRGGGLSITVPGRATTAGAVVRALEGVAPVVDCHEPPCPLVSAGCRLRDALVDAQSAFLATLDAQTIEDLASPLMRSR
ncbi:MAG: Rrf2 family transcriptional regulator [Nocardioides sp.]